MGNAEALGGKEKEIENRKEIEKDMKDEVEEKLQELRDFNAPDNHPDKIAATDIYEKIVESKQNDEEASYFELINTELDRFVADSLSSEMAIEDINRLAIAKTLRNAREVLIDKAKSLRIFDHLRE